MYRNNNSNGNGLVTRLHPICYSPYTSRPWFIRRVYARGLCYGVTMPLVRNTHSTNASSTLLCSVTS